MSFFRQFKARFPKIPDNKRIVLLVGGGGILGSALLGRRPPGVFIINITKNSRVEMAGVMGFNFDISKDAEKAVLYLTTITESIDVVINAAFTSHYVDIGEIKRSDFIEEFTLNSFVPIQLTQLCVKYFWSKDPREKNIEMARKVINISSGAGFGKTKRPELAIYSGTKAALNVMTEYLADYTAKYGVSSHIISPGSLKEKDIMKRTIDSIWDLQAKKISSFSAQKIN